MTKLLDIQESISSANGNVSLAKDLFSMLLSELDLRLETIENSFKTNDLQTLAEHVHKLYGATAYCIVPELRDTTEKLEHALNNKKLHNLEELINRIKTAIQLLISKGPDYLELDWEKYI